MSLGDRRVIEEIVRPVSDDPVEPLGAVVDPLERGGGGQKLERAAHREPLVGAMLERPAGLRVDDRGAEAAALAFLDPGEARIGEVETVLGGRASCASAKRRSGGGQSGEEQATTAM